MSTKKEDSYFDNFLFSKLSSSKKVFWAGRNPPISWFINNNDILEMDKDHRLPRNLHQSFEIVYLQEINLGEFKNWPTILDEALRLLEPDGLLFIKMTDTHLLSIFELKNFLNSWGSFSVYGDIIFPDRTRLLAFRNQSREKRPCNLKTFSFGVISNGAKLENLKSFIDSVLNIEKNNGEQIEIIVCGPDYLRDFLEKYGPKVVFIEEPADFKSLGWITKKKNLIVKCSKYENLIIAHDRYIIPKDFIEILKNYGEDWSVLVCRQELEDGTRIPDWVTMGNEWGLTTPGILDYGDWSRNIYINGGIIIAKKYVLDKTNWNELLFWNQAEDVELTRMLQKNGAIPRLIRNLKVISLPLRKNMLEGFEYLPSIKDKHVAPGLNYTHFAHINNLVNINQSLIFSANNQSLLQYQGVYIDKSWNFEPCGILLKPKVSGFISFPLNYNELSDLKVVFKIQKDQKVDNFSVNEKKIKLISINSEKLEGNIPAEALKLNSIIRIRLSSNDTELIIKELVIQRNFTNDKIYKSVVKIIKSNKSILQKTLLLLILVFFVPLMPILKFVYGNLRYLKNKAASIISKVEKNF